MKKVISNDNTGATIDHLSHKILQIQDVMQANVAHAVNLTLTARNWLIGYYIIEYEQLGSDRAKYGTRLLNNLAKRINRRGLDARRLRDFRLFYSCYPQLANEVLEYINKLITGNKDNHFLEIWQTASAKSQTIMEEIPPIWRMASAKLDDYQTPPSKLFNRLLDRQVSSLYFERMGLSKDKLALRKYVETGSDVLTPQHVINDPVTLEFLGLQEQNVFNESKLESAILNHIQHFLLEMGKGFCFEARQKRILVDQDYFKADLIFYHRILKCHVIVDLKIDRFRHEYASQLNLYLNYYRHEVMQPNDNPPIGLLLCTDYGETTVKYATEGLSQNLFVSKYRLQLPSEEEIRNYLMQNINPEDYVEK